MTDDKIALRELLEKGSDATFRRAMTLFNCFRELLIAGGGSLMNLEFGSARSIVSAPSYRTLRPRKPNGTQQPQHRPALRAKGKYRSALLVRVTSRRASGATGNLQSALQTVLTRLHAGSSLAS